MNIYLVERTDGVDYDEYDSFVCYAESEQMARCIHPSGCDRILEDYSYWVRFTEVSILKITLIGSNDKITESSVILSSFNAG